MNQIIKLNAIEQALLDWISAHTNDTNLSQQLATASVKRRDYMKTGFFIYLDSDPDCATVDTKLRPVCPRIISAALMDGAGCNLFLRSGRLHYLEIYARGGFIPESLEEFHLQPDDGS